MTSVPFARPMIGEEEIAEVIAVLKSGWLTTGTRCRQFESDFKTFMGGDVEAIAVNSCTAGLHLALEAIGITEGDEVIVPTHTFTATAEVIRYLNATPVIVDVMPDTLCIDVAAVSRAITPKTKAIIPVHYAGRACDMDALLDLAREKRLKVIEDAAHALPTIYKGTRIGALQSDITVFSFYANKTITTGEGGMIVTRDPALAARCRVMRTHGIDRDAFDRFTAAQERPSWYYEVVAPGFKYNMPDLAAAVGIHQLAKCHLFQEQRAAIAARYMDGLKHLPLDLPPTVADVDMHAWHLFVVQLKTERLSITRNEFIAALSTKGIGTGVHYMPLHDHPYWKNTYGLDRSMFPVSSAAFERIISLPLFPGMRTDEVEAVIRAVTDVCDEHAVKAA